MAFESLQDKFSRIIKKIKGHTRLTEQNMDEMLKEVRIALLEADVNFRVVKDFVNNIKEKAVGEKVYDKLNPGQMVVKIVRDELENLLSSEHQELNIAKNTPTIIMLVGLQGSGKTTHAGKLAHYFKTKLNKKPLLAACDVYRPAAIDQLETIAKQIGVDIVSMRDEKDPVKIAKAAHKLAFDDHYGALIIDTAGRLHVDEELMDELKNIKAEVKPDEILLLVDAMSGQDANNVAKTFNDYLALTGIIMSKLDGDSRGGAALSIKKMTGVPIKLIGTGEKIENLDVFHPDRMAERILGMGDILTLVEKVQDSVSEKEMKKDAEKFMSGKFDLEDMLAQMKKIKKLGSFSSILKLLPNMPKISDEQKALAEKEMKNLETIMNSMTPYERKHPECLKHSRKVRIANGSGTTAQDINRMLKKYEQMKEATKMLNNYRKSGKMPPMGGGFGGFPGL